MPSVHLWVQSELKLRFWKEEKKKLLTFRINYCMSTKDTSKPDRTWPLLCRFCTCSYRNHWSPLRGLPQTQYRESTYDHLWALWERKYQFVHGKGYEELVVPKTGGTGEIPCITMQIGNICTTFTPTWSERWARSWSSTVACRTFKPLLCNTTQFVLFWTSIWICTKPLKLRLVRLGCSRRW